MHFDCEVAASSGISVADVSFEEAYRAEKLRFAERSGSSVYPPACAASLAASGWRRTLRMPY